jgi:hypothetical protein
MMMRLRRDGAIHENDWGSDTFSAQWSESRSGLEPGFHGRPPSPDYPADEPAKEVFMSADTKTPLEHVNDTVVQLKEMRHYAKNNVELLTTQWLLFDGELSKLKRAEKIEQLMTLQGQFYDALEEAIADLEGLSVELQPPPPEE